MTARTLSWRYRLGVASRACAAIFGGYALAALFAICAARVLPLDKSEAVLAGALPSFLVYCAAVVWIFSTRSALRAWVGILGAIAVVSLVAWLAGGSQ